MTKDEFLKPYRAKMQLGLIFLLGSFVIAMIVACRSEQTVVAKPLKSYGDFLRNTFAEHEILGGLLAGVGAAIWLSTFALVFCFPAILFLRRHGPCCPECGRHVRKGFALKYGCCNNCKAILFSLECPRDRSINP